MTPDENGGPQVYHKFYPIHFIIAQPDHGAY